MTKLLGSLKPDSTSHYWEFNTIWRILLNDRDRQSFISYSYLKAQWKWNNSEKQKWFLMVLSHFPAAITRWAGRQPSTVVAVWKLSQFSELLMTHLQTSDVKSHHWSPATRLRFIHVSCFYVLYKVRLSIKVKFNWLKHTIKYFKIHTDMYIL